MSHTEIAAGSIAVPKADHMAVRPATPADLLAIDSLRKKYGDELGFLPIARYEHIVNQTLDRGRRRWEYERLYIIEDNQDLTGFVLGSVGRWGGKCEQVCVREDARRLERASRLVASIETECIAKSLPMLRCRVASDIDANAFWTAIGYEAVGETTSTWLNTKESKSKRKLTVYHKPLLPRLFDRSNR